MKPKPPVWRPARRARWRIDLAKRLAYQRGVQVGRAEILASLEDVLERAGYHH